MMLRNKGYIWVVIVSLMLITSCRDTVLYGPDPYAGGREGVDIRFAEELPSPSQGRAGTTMTFKVYGVEKYGDKVQFLINSMEAEITEITDSTITAILPQNVSTGGTSVVIEGQIYPGPVCQVLGKLGLDPTFSAGSGANGPIFSIKQLSSGQVFLGGMFTDYNGFSSATTISGIARITANGEFVRGMAFGEGVIGGSIRDIHELTDGNLLISGSISNYDSVALVRNITKINPSGALITELVEILNLTDDPEKSTLEVPIFNGGTISPITRSFVHGNKVTVIGGFGAYTDNYYQRSTYDNILMDIFPVGSVVRMHLDGRLDSTFNLNQNVFPVVSNLGFDGLLLDGYLQPDEKLIVVGRYNRYNGVSVSGNIIRLNADGTVDNTFQSGSGANETIYTIARSSYSNKYFLTGFFTSYNGIAANGLVVLDENGAVDPSFTSRGFSGGRPNYVKQLTNGLILVAGSFNKYGEVTREGLCILNPDGSLAEDYNNTGKLDGVIYDAIEGTNSLGQKTVTLVGVISRFNAKSNIGNIMRLTIQD